MDEVLYFNETFEDVHDEFNVNLYIFLIGGITCALPSVAVDLFIIYVIKIYVGLRIKRNIFILNWCISDLVYQLLGITQTLCAVFCIYAFSVCIDYTLDIIIEILNFLIMIAFFIDYIYNKLNNKKLFCTMIILWSITLIYALTETILCAFNLDTYYYVSASFFLHIFVYVVYLIKSIHLIIRKVQKKYWNEEDKLRYILTSIFVIYQVFHSVFVYFYFHNLQIIVCFIQHTQMIVFLMVLIKFDINFKLCFKNVIKCKKQTNIIVKYNDVDEVEINN